MYKTHPQSISQDLLMLNLGSTKFNYKLGILGVDHINIEDICNHQDSVRV